MNRAGLLYLAKAVTPLHLGAGESVDKVADLTIQRDTFGIPLIEGTSLKGGLRRGFKKKLSEGPLKLIFGSEPERRELEAGAVSVLGTMPLLIPVRSLFGGWAYVTSPWLLFLFSNRLKMAGDGTANTSKVIADLVLDSLELKSNEALTPSFLSENIDGKDLLVLLDEYIFRRREPSDSFNIFVKMLTDSGLVNELDKRLVVVPDEFIKVFSERGIWIQQRVKLTKEKTVETGGLWSEERIPPDTILHASFLCSESRAKLNKDEIEEILKQVSEFTINEDKTVKLKPEEVREILKNAIAKYPFLIIGGDETVGTGILELREFKYSGTVKGERGIVKLPKPEDVSLASSISERARLKDACEKITEDRPEEVAKELASLPVLMAQAGIIPTYFYYNYKGKKDEKKKREWWVWKNMSYRVCKVVTDGLNYNEIPEPLVLKMLEWDGIRYALELKALGKVKGDMVA